MFFLANYFYGNNLFKLIILIIFLFFIFSS